MRRKAMVALVGDDDIKAFVGNASAIRNPVIGNTKQTMKNDEGLVAQAAVTAKKKFHCMCLEPAKLQEKDH